MSVEAAVQILSVEGGRTELVVVVNPHARIIRRSDDEVVFIHGTRSLFSEVLADRRQGHLLGRLIDRLRRPASVRQLIEEGLLQPSELGSVIEAIDYMIERKLLIAAPVDLRRSYLSTFVGDPKRLAGHQVRVAGQGALAERIASRLREICGVQVGDGEAPDIQAIDFTDPATILDVFESASFVVVAQDSVTSHLLHSANEAAIKTRTPWMSVYMDGSEAVIGPAYVPGHTSCFLEFELQTEASLANVDRALTLKEQRAVDAPAQGYVLPCYVDIVCGYAVTACMHFLLTETTFTVNRAVHLDLETLELDYQSVMRIPRCPACGPFRAPYRNPFL